MGQQAQRSRFILPVTRPKKDVLARGHGIGTNGAGELSRYDTAVDTDLTGVESDERPQEPSRGL